MSYVNRFVGIDNLPSRLSDFDVEHFFALSRLEIEAIAARFRSDKPRVAAAVQLVMLRATGRPFDRFAIIPRNLLRKVCESLGASPVSIASLRSLYERRPTLYEHQRWAREHLGLREFDDGALQELRSILALAAGDAVHTDDLVTAARMALFERRVVIPGGRRLLILAREAFAEAEAQILDVIGRLLQPAEVRRATEWAYTDHPQGKNHLEWLKAGPQGHAPSTLAETLDKIRALKDLGVHGWTLQGIPLAKQRAYAAHVQMRRPSMTARIADARQTIELVCFLRISLLELTDSALQQASRRSRDLLRRAAARAEEKRAGSRVGILQAATQAKSILHDESKTWHDRVIEARTLLDALDGERGSFAGEVRKALAEDHRRVQACLAALSGLEFGGSPGDPAMEQWQAWSHLQAAGATQLPPDSDKPRVSAAWRDLVDDEDAQAGYRAFGACTLMSLRQGLRRGSVWVDHSLAFRDRLSLLIGDEEWAGQREQHATLLRLPTDASDYLTRALAGASAGMAALAEAVSRGKVEIGDYGQLHLPALAALPEDQEPRRTREALFKRIGHVQLPDLLLDVDAATHFSPALLGHRAGSASELLGVRESGCERQFY